MLKYKKITVEEIAARWMSELLKYDWKDGLTSQNNQSIKQGENNGSSRNNS